MSHTLCQRVPPDLQLMDAEGKPQRLFTKDAPYTFVVFWDPTCGHCLKVVPEMYNIYNRNKDKGWRVYSIAARDKEKEWKEYMAKHPELNEWTNVCKVEENTIWHLNLYNYNNISNPTIFILDKDRKVIAKKIDVEKIEDVLKHYEEIKAKRSKS